MTTRTQGEVSPESMGKAPSSPVGARQTASGLLLAPLEARGPTPAKTLPRNAVRPIERIGIG
jgi:hypothetical protein